MRCGKAIVSRNAGDFGYRVEHSTGCVRQDVERLQRATSAVPPVGVPLVDRTVRGERRDIPIETFDDEADDLGPLGRFAGGIEKAKCGDQDVAVDPGVPVVHVPVEADPMPVATADERLEHPQARLVPDASPQPGEALVQRGAEDMIDPGELADDLAGAEIEERIGDGRQHRAMATERVVVRGPAPGALLAEHHDTVGHLVDPVVRAGGRRGHDRAAQPVLTGERGALPELAIAVAVHPRGRARKGKRPRRAEVEVGAAEQIDHGGPIGGAGRDIPHGSVADGRNGQCLVRRDEQFAERLGERTAGTGARLPPEHCCQWPGEADSLGEIHLHPSVSWFVDSNDHKRT